MDSKVLYPRQLTWLTVLRIAIGWHFLYEGITKIFNTEWSAYGYLMTSVGFLKGFFISLAENEGMLDIVSFLNAWGLTLIGLALFIGLFTRITCYFGASLLLLYYLSHPPFIGIENALPLEGHYLIVDKNLIEMIALIVISLFPTGSHFGLDLLIKKKRNQ
jgi:thiosulfate dehydrogenase [quinone] large subunit